LISQWLKAIRSASVIALVAVALTACGKSDDKTAEQKPTGQVIAKVGDQDVTITELNNERRHAQVPANAKPDDVTRALLNSIVERKVMAKRALDQSLDRQPTTLLELLRSREAVLAEAYVSGAFANQTPVSDSEVQKFIADNPRMFDHQEVLFLDQVVVDDNSLTQDVLTELQPAKNLEQIEKTLDGHGIRHFRRVTTTSSAILPAAAVARFADSKPGDVFLIRNPPATYFSVVTGHQTQPLDGKAAAEVARNVLQTRKNAEALAEIRKVALNGVNITYEGDYAKIMTAKADAEGTTQQTSSVPNEADKGASNVNVQSSPTAQSPESTVEKP
jgi:EpsD family peptidyl-prolyl cis-trans isomerase